MFAGHHGAYEYDVVWYSDDGGATYTTAKNASGNGEVAKIWLQDEVALAEGEGGEVFLSMRNEAYHKGYPQDPNITCNCRGLSRSLDGGSTFGPSVPAPVLVGPVCEATMLSLPKASGDGHIVFHANPGHGTDKESKSPPNGRATGTVRRSEDGGRTWVASVDLNGDQAYSYSCLTRVPQPGYIGVAFETVLPGSDVKSGASANNIVFTLVPQNFSNHRNRE